VIAVEPGESAVLSGGSPGAHDIEGIGIGYEPPLWDSDIVDEVISVSTQDAKEMAGSWRAGKASSPAHLLAATCAPL
jgi:cysteine synthase